MTWGEAQRLILILLTDTSSRTCAAVRGWDSPIGREDVVVRDLYDAFARVNFKRPDPYPRPWHPKPKKLGTASVTAAEFKQIQALVAERAN